MGPEQDYRIGARIGQGGAGTVFEATHRQLGVLAAIKRLPGRDATEEAAMMARVDHPHVLRVFDAGRDGTGSWIAMQRATGPLDRVVDPLAWHRVVSGILTGLAAAHASGLLHLDLKPANLLVLADGRVVLADFGIAAVGPRARPTLGTPAWMAPEAFQGHADVRTDLYAVGCVAFALLTGTPPFPDADPALAHARRPVPPFPADRSVPVGAHDWIQRLMAKHPDDRFQHAADALAALPAPIVAASSAAGWGADEAAGFAAPTVPLATAQTGGEVPSARASSWAALRLPPSAPRWPRRPDRALAGAGLLGLLRVPFTEHQASLDRFWSHLLDVERNRVARHVAVTGARGTGVGRFIAEACRIAWAAGAAKAPGDRVAVVRDGDLQPATLRIDEDLERADAVITLPTLDLAAVRTALVAWGPCDRRLVTTLADRCGGDLAAAVAAVHRGVADGALVWKGSRLTERRPFGLEIPLELRAAVVEAVGEHVEAAATAAAIGHDVDRRWLERSVGPTPLQERLVRAGLASPRPEGFRWCGGAARAIAAELATVDHVALAAAVPADHGEVAWQRARHRVLAGDLDAVAALCAHVATRAAAGAMVETEVELLALEERLEGVLADDDPLWVRFHSAFASLGPTHLGYEAAEERGRRALAALERCDIDVRDRWSAQVHARLGWLGAMRGWPRRARPHVEACLRVDPMAQGGALNLAFVLIGEGRSAAALQAFLTAAQRARDAGDHYGEHSGAAAACIALTHLGRTDEALAGFHHHIGRLHDEGFHAADADSQLNIAECLRAAGRIDEAMTAYLEALRLSETGQARADLGVELGWAMGHLDAGDPERAEAILAGCQARLDDEGPTWEALVGLHLAAASACRGRPVDGPAVVAHIGRLHQTGHVEPEVPRSLRRIAARIPAVAAVALEEAQRIERRLGEGRALDPEDLAMLGEPVGAYCMGSG